MSACTAEDAYQSTLNKRHAVEQAGHRYVEMWECQLARERKVNCYMDKILKENTREEDQPISDRCPFYGGRVNAIKMFHAVSDVEGDRLDYYDFTSLYPYVQKYCRFPVGAPRVITENFEAYGRYFGVVKCTVLCPKDLYFPVLPYRCGGKLMFGLCRTCMHNQIVHNCTHSDDERAITGTWCTPELDVARHKGCVISNLKEVWHYDKTSQYNGTPGSTSLFGEYVNTFLALKQQASGWPEWCVTDAHKDKYIADYYTHEGIKLDRTKMANNPGQRSIAKLLLNSFWLDSI